MEYWESYKYKNLTVLFLSLLIAFFAFRIESFHTFLLQLGNFGYIGAFVAGVLFVSTFTVATGAVILLVLAEQLSAIEIGLVAGLGAVVGDMLIFRFVKDTILEEITPIYHTLGGKHVTAILHSRYFSWSLPVIGAIIIATPLPDEIGVSLMGIAKMNTYTFFLLAFVLNAVGIFLVVSASMIIKP